MELRGLMKVFYTFSEWATRLAYLNVLWIGFSLSGLLIFGVMPATVGMFAVTGRWLSGDLEFPLFPVFWNSFRKEFIRSNVVGFVFGLFIFLTLMDIRLFAGNSGLLFYMFKSLLLGLFVICPAALVYVFPISATYHMTLRQVFLVSIFVAATRPVRTFLLLLACSIVVWLTFVFPMPLFLFNGSSMAWLIMWSAKGTFQRMDGRLVRHLKAPE